MLAAAVLAIIMSSCGYVRADTKTCTCDHRYTEPSNYISMRIDVYTIVENRTEMYSIITSGAERDIRLYGI